MWANWVNGFAHCALEKPRKLEQKSTINFQLIKSKRIQFEWGSILHRNRHFSRNLLILNVFQVQQTIIDAERNVLKMKSSRNCPNACCFCANWQRARACVCVCVSEEVLCECRLSRISYLYSHIYTYSHLLLLLLSNRTIWIANNIRFKVDR